MLEEIGMDIDIKILLVCDNTTMKEDIMQKSLSSYQNVHSTTSREMKKEIDRVSPNLVILVEPEDHSGIELAQYIQSELESTFLPIILYISTKQNFQMLRDLVRTGVNDYFVLPDEFTNFTERLQRVVHVLREQQDTQLETVATTQALKKGKGQIYSFYSGKGGTGRTILSTLFAQTMKFEATADVIFIDLNLQYGGAESFLGIESNRSLADLLPVLEELNETHIYNVAIKEPYSKLDMLLSPKDAEVGEKILEENIVRLLRTCRRAYDFVVVDLPSQMDPLVFAALEESDVINYVLTLDTPAIRNYKAVTELFTRLGIDTTNRMQVVLNGIEKQNELTPNDIKEIVSAPVAAKIRENKKGIHPIINKGEPLRKETKEKKLPVIAKDVRKWVLSNLK